MFGFCITKMIICYVTIIAQFHYYTASQNVFKRVLFNHIFGYLNMHNLIKKNQSGFIPGDSTY